MKFTTAITGLLVAAAGVFAAPVPAPVAVADPPGIPSATSARTLLAGLTVAAAGSSADYDRSLFRHWHIVSGTCDSRETVLVRDGSGVSTDSACQPTSGTWFSPYDGVTVTQSSSVDIDHMVPLANAWISGASTWTAARREAFANDLSGPQLWAVSASTNRSKGDRSPDLWSPPVTAFRCTYARSWIQVKSSYSLTITSAERTALTSMLNTC
ncbi:secreted protein [Verticillium alfalfae VaMs.102]|uniref:Secreted protein n=1 Tax=Verticillium alfalfae (strain VaMs.102 / ATCC MYA-4576 / FGSC 10136) TaxID=526221 RepID=C9SD56_VERA1|nr:secreted protein [Verticillium alfalfae VaMs.102]EEY17021.1 secreted protein [Verticillium alfalfae VaMs.102]